MMHTFSSLYLFVLTASTVLVTSCSPPPAPVTPQTTNAARESAEVKSKTATEASARPSGSAESTAPTAAPESPHGPPVYAQIHGIEVPPDEPTGRRVLIEFFNSSEGPCQITGYQLTWPGGKKGSGPKTFALPGQESRQRKLRVHASDGDLSTLTTEGATMDVTFGCEAE